VRKRNVREALRERRKWERGSKREGVRERE